MLEVGTVVEVQLPGQQASIRATVLSCSPTMQSVRLQELGSEVVHRVSLKKLPYTVVQQPGEQQPAAGQQQEDDEDAAGSSSDEEQDEQPLDGSSSEEEGDEQDAAAPQQQAGQPQRTEQQAQDADTGSEPEEDGGEDGEEEDAAAASEDEQEQDEAAELDAFNATTAAAIEAFASAVESDPAAFLQPTAELAGLAKAAAKALYDYQAAFGSGGAGASAPAAALPELYIDGFDAEQIWLQLELAAGPALKQARKLLKKAGQAPQLLTPEMEEAIDELLEEHEGGSSGKEDGDSEGELSGSEGEEEEEEEGGEGLAGLDGDLADLDYDALLAAGAAQRRRRQQAAGSESESEDEEVAAAQQLAGSKRKRLAAAGAARAAVEDEHFKLDEMEAFVQQAERMAAGLDNDDEAEEDMAGSDDEETELEALLDKAAAQTARDKKQAKKARKKKKLTFGDVGDEDEDEEGENVGAAAMFEDFFGPRGGRQGPATVAAGGARRQQQEPLVMDDEEGSEEEDKEGEGASEEEGFEDDMLSEDMMSGEEEEEEEEEGGRGGGRQLGLANGEAQLDSNEEEGSEDEDEEDEGGVWFGGRGKQRGLLEGSEDEEDELAPSAHERRQQRMLEKIRKLEEVAMGEKDWFMRGEVDAGRRPKNSALEVDLDFETTVKPPPQPTEEMTQTLDELIKSRIAEGRFDDVVRVVAPPPETKRTTLELDDKKPQQGLGEIYEQEYMQTVAGMADDKDEEVRQSARAQFSALCAKLDALSHLHFTPRPVIEEVTVKVDVPAIMMEEAAPQFVSGASMQAPEEVFASQARGAPKAEEELEREERKRRRAQKKRAGKKRRSAKDEERAVRAVAQGGTAPLAGRKSEAMEQAARKLEKGGKKGGRGGPERAAKKSEFSKSASVFAKIQQHADGTTAAAEAAAKASGAPRASHLKL